MNECKMSLFQNPIAPQRDPQGRILKAATLTPAMEVTPADVYQLITCNEPLHLATLQVRNAADIRAAKASLLPYVTPCGVFTRRNCRSLLKTSGLVVVDIDHLDSLQEAEQMRRTLFDDPFLCPVLCFVSPGGRGVKAFVPYRCRTKCRRKHVLGNELRRDGLRRRYARQAHRQRRGHFGQGHRACLFPVP